MPGYWNGFQEHASFLTETIGVYPNQNNLSLKQPSHCQNSIFLMAGVITLFLSFFRSSCFIFALRQTGKTFFANLHK